MEKTKKVGFLKRLKMALFELENYIQFISEKTGKALLFSLKLAIIMSLIVAVTNVVFIYAKYNSIDNYLNTIVPDFVYENSELKINDEDLKSDEKKESAIILQHVTANFKDVLSDSYSKNDLLSYVQNNQRNITIIGAVAIFIESILNILILWITIAFLTSFIGWIVLRFLKIKMKYSKLYALSIYASTLSVILTIIYNMLNNLAGIYIDIFDYLTMLISYIYITAVIYMIRSDLVKQQIELIKIATVQAQVKEQLEREQKEKQDEKKQEDNEEKKDNKNKKDDESEKDDVCDDEPDGSEI